MERGSASTSVRIVAPEDENPDIDSKNASIGAAVCGSARTYGSAPKNATSSHSRATTR
jgi:hypothetical protein